MLKYLHVVNLSSMSNIPRSTTGECKWICNVLPTCITFAGEVKFTPLVLWEAGQPTHQKVVSIFSCTQTIATMPTKISGSTVKSLFDPKSPGSSTEIQTCCQWKIHTGWVNQLGYQCACHHQLHWRWHCALRKRIPLLLATPARSCSPLQRKINQHNNYIFRFIRI